MQQRFVKIPSINELFVGMNGYPMNLYQAGCPAVDPAPSAQAVPVFPRPQKTESVTRGSWCVSEDALLRAAVQHFGINHWDAVASSIPGRTATQCRERWMFRISPGLKKTPFESWEDELIVRERGRLGNHWTQIAAKLPGRTSCSVKNRWYTVLRKHNPVDEIAPEGKEEEPELRPFDIQSLLCHTQKAQPNDCGIAVSTP